MNAEDVDHREREIADRIVAEFSPSMILLFGSRARGDALPDSDVDLIVVWKDENPPPRRSAAVRLALGRVGLPMDLAAAKILANEAGLEGIVCFHCQQAVEKSVERRPDPLCPACNS